MIKYILTGLIIVSLILPAAAWQKTAHFISLPIIEGAGIYSSVRYLNESSNVNTRASAITSLSLLGVNAALGGVAMFDPGENYAVLRPVHRMVGYAITAAGIWLSVSGALDSSVRQLDKGIAYGYTALTVVPLVIFLF